jgi:hypothetical protein
VKVKKQLDATKYSILFPQHVSGTNMAIIRSRATSFEQCSLQAAQRYTTQAAFQVWPPKSGSYLLIVLLMMGIFVPETCWGNKTAYFVASSWFFTFTMSTMHGHMNINMELI